MTFESEQQKTKWFFASLVVLALVINWRFALSGPQFAAEPESQAASAAQKQQAPAQPPSVVTAIGLADMTTRESTEIPVNDGEGWSVEPAKNLAYELYINGQLVRTVPVSKPSDPPLPRFNDSNTRTIGFRLVRGQGMGSAKMAYVKFRGTDPPSDWYSRALAMAPQSAPPPSGVLFSDDFYGYTIDSSKWIVSGDDVFQQDHIIYIETKVTDGGGKLLSIPIAVNRSGLITITRQVSLHCGNDFFDGSFDIKIGSMPGFAVKYANMAQLTDPKYRACQGFFLTKDDSSPDVVNDVMNVSEPAPPIWDAWFNEKVTYNPSTGFMEYFVNGVKQQTFNVGLLPYTDSPTMTISFTAWGWYTGHEHSMQNLKVTQEPSGS